MVPTMVRLVPEEPTFTTASEREVWERLRDGLGPDDVLLANLRLTDETKDHEADLVVLMPDVGIARARGQGRQRLVRRGRLVDQTAAARTRGSTRSTRRGTRSTPCAHYVEHDPRWGSRTTSRGRTAS